MNRRIHQATAPLDSIMQVADTIRKHFPDCIGRGYTVTVSHAPDTSAECQVNISHERKSVTLQYR